MGGVPVLLTEFEQLTARWNAYGLDDCLGNRHIRDWVHENYKHRYVPEKLLKAMGIVLNDSDVGMIR